MAINPKPPTAISTDDKVVFFDNVCNLCSGSVRFILRYNKDRSIKFASVQSDLGQCYLKQNGLPADQFESMLYLEDGLVYTKSSAAIMIAKRLCWPWRVFQFMSFMPKILRDWLYDRVALNRYKIFGKSDQCYLPDENTRNRFLDI